MSASFEKMSSSVTLHLNRFHLFRHRPVMSVHKVSVFTLSPLCWDVVWNAFVSRTVTLIWCFSVYLQSSPLSLNLFIEKKPSCLTPTFLVCPLHVHPRCLCNVFNVLRRVILFFVSCQSWWRSKATHRAFQSVMSSFNSTLRLNSIQSKLRCETLVWHR